MWKSDEGLPAGLADEIHSLRNHPHSRVAQLCCALVDLIRDERATTARNDSLVRWLLARRNTARITKLYRLVPSANVVSSARASAAEGNVYRQVIAQTGRAFASAPSSSGEP